MWHTCSHSIMASGKYCGCRPMARLCRSCTSPQRQSWWRTQSPRHTPPASAQRQQAFCLHLPPPPPPQRSILHMIQSPLANSNTIDRATQTAFCQCAFRHFGTSFRQAAHICTQHHGKWQVLPLRPHGKIVPFLHFAAKATRLENTVSAPPHAASFCSASAGMLPPPGTTTTKQIELAHARTPTPTRVRMIICCKPSHLLNVLRLFCHKITTTYNLSP